MLERVVREASMELHELATAFTRPHYLSPLSAWVEHIPFAFYVMDTLRPAAMVELGTHLGDSYCAFCQAVNASSLSTRCTAVDTWRGDAHAGLVDDGALAGLRAYHDPVYGRFSRLLQCSFDDALAGFSDGSIDLLHIDGTHTYAAVRHDFDAWLPKLSSRGVILMHDTRVMRDDFGVHRVWAEIHTRYPSFEFHHGYGLGVLAVGREIVPGVGRFLEWANAGAEIARDFFAALGARLMLARHAAGLEAIISKKSRRGPPAPANLAPQAAQWLDAPDLKTRTDALEATLRRRLRGWPRMRF